MLSSAKGIKLSDTGPCNCEQAIALTRENEKLKLEVADLEERNRDLQDDNKQLEYDNDELEFESSKCVDLDDYKKLEAKIKTYKEFCRQIIIGTLSGDYIKDEARILLDL